MYIYLMQGRGCVWMWSCFRTCRRWDQVWMKMLLVRNGALVLNFVLKFLHVCIQASSCVSSTCCSQHSITTTTTGHHHHLQHVASPVPHPARPPPVAAPPTPPWSSTTTPGALTATTQPPTPASSCAHASNLCPHSLQHPITIPFQCASAAQQLATPR